ncbi:unnamed protein product [Callosobruchus maculatus]|uniref:Uncharacterized protein n=1 Tax=Callosobruchus maculatus TaxID=64391 RepID=A0A653CKB0_CALMS|nr:unnamed protein product [Callosobruchus maculatus]
MDNETGEFVLDTETGESRPWCFSTFDVETGEYEDVPLKKFKIPSHYYTPPEKEKKSKQKRPLRKADRHEIALIHAAIFLLPTFVLFHPVVAIFVAIVETVLHSWSHKSNQLLKSNRVYFQSPLHPIVKEICGKCKAEQESLRITKMQDVMNDKLRKHGLDYIRRVVT